MDELCAEVVPGRVGGECLQKGKGAPCVELARCEKGLCRCYHRHALTVTTPDLKCRSPGGVPVRNAVPVQ